MDENFETVETVERRQVIGVEDVRRALEILKKYKSGKASIDQRAIAADQWWRLRNWEEKDKSKISKDDPKPSSAWMFNSISNKHADAMDNYPVPSVLPRERQDENDAKILSKVLPVIFEQAQYEKCYSDAWWDKLITGTAVYSPVWDNTKLNGLGDIDVRRCNILNVFWEPGIEDIQNSANFFHVEWADNERLEETYPQLKDKLGGQAFTLTEFVKDDSVDTSEKSLVVDWYYKKNGILHFCKFVGDEILFADENDPENYPNGWYEHGKYPFVFDPLFIIRGTPCGFGYVEEMKGVQGIIDDLDNAILKNALASSRLRYFIKGDGAVNEKEFSDATKDLVHVNSSSLGEDSIRQIITSPLPPIYANYLQMKIEELKETSGNRDFSQGATAGGVTSGSAIAALQEAGSKLSRDIIKAGYRANAETGYMVIELIRQFYTEAREFRITGADGVNEYVSFDNSNMRQQPPGDDLGVKVAEGGRVPIFDIKIIPQKSSTYSREIQNERAKEFFAAGFFNPQAAEQALSALEMMDFEGKEKVIDRVKQGQTYMQIIEQLQTQVVQLGNALKTLTDGSAAGESSDNDGSTTPHPSADADTFSRGRRLNSAPGEISADGLRRGTSEADKMRERVKAQTAVSGQ